MKTNKDQESQPANGSESVDTNGCVLKVIVTNLVFPVTIEVLKEVCLCCLCISFCDVLKEKTMRFIF